MVQTKKRSDGKSDGPAETEQPYPKDNARSAETVFDTPAKRSGFVVTLIVALIAALVALVVLV